MKFVSIILAMLLFTGCASMYNHNRVKDNIAKRAIIASSNDSQITLLRKGADPSEVLKVSAYSQGNDVTIMAAVNILDLEGFQGYLKTYSEAPLSSTAALLIDVGTAVGIGYAAYEQYKGDTTTVEQPLIDADANDTASPNSGSTITAGSNPVIIQNSGNGNTFNIGNTDDHSSDQDNSNVTN